MKYDNITRAIFLNRPNRFIAEVDIDGHRETVHVKNTACPKSHGRPGIAYGIAKEAFPDILSKELLLLEFPMRKDDLSDAHQKAAEEIIYFLSSGKNVAFLSLGDPGGYSTFYYVAGIIKEQGYEIEIISGITSFSAASAKIKVPVHSLGNPGYAAISCAAGNDFLWLEFPGIYEPWEYPGNKANFNHS